MFLSLKTKPAGPILPAWDSQAIQDPWSASAGQGGGNETGPPGAYTLLDLIPCYFFLVEKVNIILFFHTERHFTIHNCDSFLTCYFRKIRKLFFTFCKDLFSYCQ